MRIATWNVNSIRTRKAFVIDFLHNADIDVFLMQETKCRDDQFPLEDFESAGYEVAHFGLNQWNGVGIASRLPLEDIEQGFPGMPGFTKNPEEEPATEARAISATVDGLRLCSVYVPNGRALDDPHLDYKLRWLEALGEHYRSYQDQPGALPVAIGGDFNVAPLDSDVGDPAFLVQGTTHTSDLERTTLQDFLHRAGLQDTVRPLVPTGYTYWDYKQGKFPKDHGMRIDFIFGSESFASQVTHASIERDQRQGDGPSDHVPVVVEVGAEDDFDRPMVF
ncbi:MAG: exodeoxyribonuclease III [Pontimonas sp.]